MSAAELHLRHYDVIGSADDETDWLERRRTGIGASEISIVLGVSRWGSRVGLYYDKIGEGLPDDEEDLGEYIAWGKLLEGAILAELARRAGVKVSAVQPLLRNTEFAWALATPDGLTAAGEPIEAKNIAWGYEEDEWAERIPEQYYLQCQHQMLVTGAQRCLFGALLWGSRLIWEWIPRDENAVQRIILGGSEFWRRVQERNPPPSDGHPEARKILGRLAIVPEAIELFEGEEVANTGHSLGEMFAAWAAAESDLETSRKNERRAKKQRDAMADEVARSLDGHRAGYTVTGWRVEWKKIERRGYQVEATSYQQLSIKPPK